MITLKDYQQRVLDSLREFLRQCARDRHPSAAFQRALERNGAPKLPYIPVAASGLETGHALRLPARAHRRRQDAAGLPRARARDDRTAARRARGGALAGAEQHDSGADRRRAARSRGIPTAARWSWRAARSRSSPSKRRCACRGRRSTVKRSSSSRPFKPSASRTRRGARSTTRTAPFAEHLLNCARRSR